MRPAWCVNVSISLTSTQTHKLPDTITQFTLRDTRTHALMGQKETNCRFDRVVVVVVVVAKMDSRTIERRIPSALSRREDVTPNEFRQRLVSIGVTTCLLSLGLFVCLWTGLLSHLCLPHGGRTETPPLRVRARTCIHSYTHPHTQATDGCNFIEFNTRLPMLLLSCCRVWGVAAAASASGRQIGSREN
jgi:hypothetical protein